VCTVHFKPRLFFPALAALLLAARLCHVGILWAEESLPLAAAGEMLRGKALYRDIWFDKPPLVAAWPLLWGAGGGWPLRLLGALYALLACWIAYRFASDVWSEREGRWAAGLLAFFLTFDLPSAVIPLASDLLLLAPHLAAVWLAWKRRPFWSGALLGVGFLISPRAVFVAAACALWNPAGIPRLAAGFAAVSGVAGAWLWLAGAWPAYWDEVWRWGRLYAAVPLAENPVKAGLLRTADWAGFHAALVVAAIGFFRGRADPRSARVPRTRSSLGESTVAQQASQGAGDWHWAAWCLLGLVGVAFGWRFFPRYYFLLLPPMVLVAARGFTLLGRRWRVAALLLLLIPLGRFGPRYLLLAAGQTSWSDTAMDRDSREVAALIRHQERPGDTLFVWGFRPEMYVYTRLPAANRFLDSQPLTGVPADRHLTESTPLDDQGARDHRAELVSSHPTFIIDGLGLYNPALAISNYGDLRRWFSDYREVVRSGQSVVYQRLAAAP